MLYALLKSGVPGNDSQLQSSVSVLTDFLESFGYPDTTEDLAWLVALYVNLPSAGKSMDEITEGLVAKLISGASIGSDKEGLWGPICVNPQYVYKLSKIVDRYLKSKNIEKLNEEIQMLNYRISDARGQEREASRGKKKRHKNSAKLDAYIKDRDKLQDELNKKTKPLLNIYNEFNFWARSGRVYNNPRSVFSLPGSDHANLNGLTITNLNIPGLYQNPYKYHITDIESTSLALFALSEAKKNDLLPDMVIGPKDRRGKAICKPIKTNDVMRQSIRQLLSRINSVEKMSSYNVSVMQHNHFKRVEFLHDFDKDVYKDVVGGGQHWLNKTRHLASLSYLSSIVPQYKKKITLRLQKRAPSVCEEFKANVVSSPKQLVLAGTAMYHHGAEMLKYSEHPLTDWQEISGSLLGKLPSNFSLVSTDSFLPISAQLTTAAEDEQGGEAPAVKPASFIPGIREVLKIDTNNQHKQYGDLRRRADLLTWLSMEPLAPLFIEWDLTKEFKEDLAFKRSFAEINKRNKPQTYKKESSDLEIYKIYRSPFLFISENLTAEALRRNSKVIKEYVTLHRGTIVFMQNSELAKKGLFSKLLKDWELEFEMTLSEKHDKGYTMYRNSKNQIYMIQLNLTDDTDQKKSQTHLAKLIYHTPSVKFYDDYLTGEQLSKLSGLTQGLLTPSFED